MINREKIHEIVKLIYSSNYKTFYVNSLNGKDFVKPAGVFVSLGLTTSLDTLSGVNNLLSGMNEYGSRLVELSSIKVGNQFLNTITNDENPTQYPIENIPEEVMDKERSEAELEELRSKVSLHSDLSTITEYSPKINRLQHLINLLDESNGWDHHGIQKADNEYRIYHLYLNYKKVEGKEYRLGIFVYDKKEDYNH